MSKFVSLTVLSHFLDKIKGIFVGAATGTVQGHVVTFGADGKTIADSGHTIATDVPENAVFTDTTYSNATTSVAGLLSAADKKKLDGVATGATVSKIDSVKVNGTALTITSKSVNIDLSSYAKTADLSSYATTSSLDSYAKKTDITSLLKYCGSVASYSKLPTSAEVGDTYNVEAADSTHGILAGDNVTWNGTAWDNLSGAFVIDEATEAEIDALFA